MANATSPESLQERLLRLAQTLQFAWFVGHVTMLAFALRYGLFYITIKTYSSFARFSYRTAFLGALITYGIVVYKGYRARLRQGKPTTAVALMVDENVQYLLMASVWLFSKQVPLALLPFVIYSTFHVLTYVRGNIIPTLQSQPATTPSGQRAKPSGYAAELIGKFIKEYYDLSMSLVAGLEIALWVRLFLSAILFQKGSWILLGIYTVFLRARYGQNGFVQSTFANIGARADAILSNQSTDPRVRQGWEQIKLSLHRAVEATDIARLTGQPQAAEQKKTL